VSTEPRQRHPVGLFDADGKRVFTSAQQDAERRSGSFLISGLILYAAAKAGDRFSDVLLEAMGCNLDQFTEAVDSEWSAQTRYLQDQPATLVNEAFQSVAAGMQPGADLHVSVLLAAMLRYPNSMASRLATRLGIEPLLLAERLTEA